MPTRATRLRRLHRRAPLHRPSSRRSQLAFRRSAHHWRCLQSHLSFFPFRPRWHRLRLSAAARGRLGPSSSLALVNAPFRSLRGLLQIKKGRPAASSKQQLFRVRGGRLSSKGRKAACILLLEPGGNPPDPPLQAWLAGGEEALGPACTSGLGRWWEKKPGVRSGKHKHAPIPASRVARSIRLPSKEYPPSE